MRRLDDEQKAILQLIHRRKVITVSDRFSSGMGFGWEHLTPYGFRKLIRPLVPDLVAVFSDKGRVDCFTLTDEGRRYVEEASA